MYYYIGFWCSICRPIMNAAGIILKMSNLWWKCWPQTCFDVVVQGAYSRAQYNDQNLCITYSTGGKVATNRLEVAWHCHCKWDHLRCRKKVALLSTGTGAWAWCIWLMQFWKQLLCMLRAPPWSPHKTNRNCLTSRIMMMNGCEIKLRIVFH